MSAVSRSRFTSSTTTGKRTVVEDEVGLRPPLRHVTLQEPSGVRIGGEVGPRVVPPFSTSDWPIDTPRLTTRGPITGQPR